MKQAIFSGLIVGSIFTSLMLVSSCRQAFVQSVDIPIDFGSLEEGKIWIQLTQGGIYIQPQQEQAEWVIFTAEYQFAQPPIDQTATYVYYSYSINDGISSPILYRVDLSKEGYPHERLADLPNDLFQIIPIPRPNPEDGFYGIFRTIPPQELSSYSTDFSTKEFVQTLTEDTTGGTRIEIVDISADERLLATNNFFSPKIFVHELAQVNATEYQISERQITDLGFSPDATQLAYIARLETANRFELGIIDLGSGNIVSKTAIPSVDAFDPHLCWSPDEQKILVVLPFELFLYQIDEDRIDQIAAQENEFNGLFFVDAKWLE